MNKKYEGSIQLISGLKPQGNLDFPLMEAKSIAFYETDSDGNTTEIRLPDKLKTLGISETEKEKLVQNAVAATLSNEAITSLQTNVNKNAEEIIKLDNSLEDLRIQVENNAGDNEKLIVHYDLAAQKLYLYEKDENGEIEFDPGDGDIIKVNQLSETIIQGGSGGGGAAATYKLSFKVAEGTKEKFSILDGRSAKLAYNVVLTEEVVDPSSGEVSYNPISAEKITYTIYKNNIYQKAITEEVVKNGELDVTDLLSLGVNNFKVVASVIEYVDAIDENGESITKPITTSARAFWTVEVVNMKLEVPDATWEASPKYAATSFVYSPIGDLQKTIHFILDGKEVGTATTSANGSSMTYIIPMQSHGIHTFEVYCDGVIEGETIKTDTYKYVLMFVDKENTTPIIRIKANDTAEQYSASRVYFNVLDPLNDIIDKVEIYENDILKNTYINITSNEQTWDFKPQDPGTKTIKIKYKEYEASKDIEVSAFPYTINPTLGELMVDFVPTGRTNQDMDYNVFKNNAFTSIIGENGETVMEEIPMTWTFSDNFDWFNGGWKVDENGDSYFCVKAGTSVAFNYNLFDKENTIAQKDANNNYSIAGTGKEFKLIFKTSNVAKPEAIWLTCKSNALNGTPVGLEMQAHNAYISSSFETLAIPYSEEDIIELDINITPITKFSATYEPDLTTKTISMIMPFEDGTPSKPQVITNPTTSFKQVEAQPITVGSEFCDVHIYRMKVYERYLTDAEILNNFIADSRSGEEMAKRFLRNQIYLPGQTRFEGKEQDLIKLAEACPDLRVYLLSAPQFTNDKDNKIGGTTIKQWYFKNGKDSIQDNWVATGCTHRGQGTSSNAYGYSGRNLDFDMKKATITLGDGKTITKKISLSPNSVPTNYLNFKANIASSENANNALLAKRFDRYLPYDTVASLNGEAEGIDVKNSMEFYNCVVFIQETNEDLSTHREFNDTEIHFYGIGNIGDSKKTDSSRLNDPDDEREFCVEIMDWNRFLSSFPQNTIVNAMGYVTDTNTNEKIYTWAKDENLGILYELIDGEYVLTKDTTIDFNKTYYVDILENDDFSEDFTYGWRYITEYETDLEKVSAEEAEVNAQRNKEIATAAHQVWKDFYKFVTRDLTTNGKEDSAKVEAWKKEFADWFILDSALYYYLFTLRYTMVDNRAKNSFWHYGKCPDGKYRFEFWDYDNDTALGIDNTGALGIPYGIEETDKDSTGSPYFRAYDSTFFTRVAKYFSSEAISLWGRTEENVKVGNAFDSTNFIKEFDDWQLQFPEELWRLDYERKYKRTYVGGEGSEWDNALPKIVDGKKVTETDFLENKMNGRKKYQRRQFERKQDTYMSSKFRGSKNLADSLRLRGSGGSTSHTIPADYTLRITPFNNMYLNLLDDGSNMLYHKRIFAGQEEVINLLDYVNTLDALNIKGGSSIQSLGDLSLLYLREAGLSAGSKLKTVILGNAADNYDNSALNIITLGESNKLLETLDIRNLKSIQSVEFTKIPSLKKLYAQGSSLKSARFANNGLLEEAYLPSTITQLELRNLYFLHTLDVENFNSLTSLTIENCGIINSLEIINNAPNLNEVFLTGIDWHLQNGTVLNRILKFNSSSLKGKVYLENLRAAELAAYKAAWPELDISYGIEVPQHSIIFKNEDEVIYTVLKDEGSRLTEEDDPVINGAIPTPTKPDSEDGQFEFTFNGWRTNTGGNFVGTIVSTSDIVFHANYTESIKKYKVTWYKDITDRSGVFAETMVDWGTNASIPPEYGVFPTKSESGDNVYYLFDKWDKTSTNITKDTKIFPVWMSSNPFTIGDKPFEELTAADIYAMQQTDTLNLKYQNPGETLIMQMGYMPTFDSIEENVLIDSKTDFDGKTAINTGIKLLETDSSFTMALDFEMGYTGGTLMSCASLTTAPNLILSSIQGNVPSITWEDRIQNVGYMAPTQDRTHREICVVRKIKGIDALYVYTNNRFSLDDIFEIRMDGFGNSINSNPLVFGARIDSRGNFSDYGTGTIHYAKLWHEDLGAEECKRICSWIYEEREFDFVGSRYHLYKNSDIKTQGTFVARELLDELIAFGKDGNDASAAYGASTIRTWLQTKPFLGTSLVWQQTIPKVEIRTLRQIKQGDKVPVSGALYYEADNSIPADNFYIPGATELSSEFHENKNNAEYATMYANETLVRAPYPIFTDNLARVRNLSSTKQAANYWTRSPYYSTWSHNAMYGVGGDVNEEKNLGTLNYSHTGAKGSTTWYYNNVASSKAGVLLVFSI